MEGAIAEGMGYRRSAVLLGDSITKNSFEAGGWGAAIAHACMRKVRLSQARPREKRRRERTRAAEGGCGWLSRPREEKEEGGGPKQRQEMGRD